MTKDILQKINLTTINAAGARYSPKLDPAAPNLEIKDISEAIENLELGIKFKDQLTHFIKEINDEGKKHASLNIKFHKDKSPKDLINSLEELKKLNPNKITNRPKIIQRIVKSIAKKLSKKNRELYTKKSDFEEYSDRWRDIQSEISSIRDYESTIGNILNFVNSSNYELIANNKMLLLGDWGSGKTHLLCDITNEREKQNLPTLFLLAHRIPSNTNPLQGICDMTHLARINESNRKAWKKYLPSILKLIQEYPKVGLILSCRTPFDKNIFSSTSRKKTVEIFHNGFQDIEFDAQREFFNYYDIPNPQLPLLTPEYSKPLFLKIMCQTLSGKTKTSKTKWMKQFASGQRGMTKLFEDFAIEIGSQIEKDFRLKHKACWSIIKGVEKPNAFVGIAVSMAETENEYITYDSCYSIIQTITQCSSEDSKAILKRMITDGLIAEDLIWQGSKMIDVVRFPYQRFSDHIIARHLLNKYLDTTSESTIRRSFYKNKPLGKIFTVNEFGDSYMMPGFASAIMIEFPERVKKVLDEEHRELVYYLPQKQRLIYPLIDVFLGGLLWRTNESFSDQTFHILNILLEEEYEHETYEVMVTLACRLNHPCSGKRLYNYLSHKTMPERDATWSEFLRNSPRSSVVRRLLNWIEDVEPSQVDNEVAKELITLLSLYLTTTDRSLRDKATKALVLLGEENPNTLFNKTIETFKFNDPYVVERMLASSYGVLMRNWAFPNSKIKEASKRFGKAVCEHMFDKDAQYFTHHLLTNDYAQKIITLTLKIDSRCLSSSQKNFISKHAPKPRISIPSPRGIKKKYCSKADSAIYMDFENYTVGRLFPDRMNYDSDHKEYNGVLKQIKWRILNLGYSEDIFKQIDRGISNNQYRSQESSAVKVDRYGKKYSWIAYFEIAGMRLAEEKLANDGFLFRSSECDIDPSFPESLREWDPVLPSFFKQPFTAPEDWIVNGGKPDYKKLLKLNQVDNIDGPWVLLSAYIGESGESHDPRRIFTFINPLLVNPKKIPLLRRRLNTQEYPGNHAIPGPAEDHYTFAGEVPWSLQYGGEYYFGQDSKRDLGECFRQHKTYSIKKRISDLSAEEKLQQLRYSQSGILETLLGSNNGLLKDESEFITVNKYETIPGIQIEVPHHRLGWESYHSEENQGGYADYITPALTEFLNLKNKGNSQDLYDSKGIQASVYRIFKTSDSTCHFLYIRKDLLQKYLKSTNQKLVWIMWGERDFKTSYLKNNRHRDDEFWSDHKYIHKQMKVCRL